MTSPVRPPVQPLTELEARHKLAEGIFPVTHRAGPTRVGLTIGCDEKTVRKARGEVSTLRLDLVFNCLLADPTALNPLLAHYGMTAVPVDAAAIDPSNLPAGVADFLAKLLAALADKTLTPQERRMLASVLRPLMPMLMSLMAEVDAPRTNVRAA